MSLLYPDMGDTCTAPMCGEFDWLSSKCKFCGDVTCGAHISPESHNCRVLQSTKCLRCGEVIAISGSQQLDEALPQHLKECKAVSAPIPTNEACCRKGCKKRELISIKCAYCNKNHCISHRLPTDHGCQPETLTMSETKSGFDMTAEEASNPFYFWTYSNSSDLMNFRKVTEDLRVGLRVFFSPEMLTRPMYFCANKNWPVGKILDLACAEMGIQNSNNEWGKDQEKLGVFLLSGKCEGLPLSVQLKNVSVSGFRTGAAIMIHRGSALPSQVINEVPRWYHFMRFRTQAIDTTSPISFFDRLDLESNSVIRQLSDRLLEIPLELRICGSYALFLLLLGRVPLY